MSSDTRISRAFVNAPHLPLQQNSRYVLFSDCHRGSGDRNDNFLTNQHIYYAALKYYYDNGFAYIELGDGDELWENRSMETIVDVHSNVFRLFSCFQKQGRLCLLYGNHDMAKKSSKFCKKYLEQSYYPEAQCCERLLPGICFHEGLILDNKEHPERSLYLTHGHQASFLNSTCWRFARFLVRYFWLPLERLGVSDPTSAAKNYSVKARTEEQLSLWAKKHSCILITGHTHRPRLPEQINSSAAYANTGSCVHPRNITCIEIQGESLSLVKWYMSTRDRQSVYIAREVIASLM